LAHDEAKDVGAPRAQSHTDSDLACSSDRFIRHDAVQADAGQEHSDHSRDGREDRERARLPNRLGNLLSLGLHLGEWNGGISLSNRLADCGGDGHRI
jgi:hypothetical protein